MPQRYSLSLAGTGSALAGNATAISGLAVASGGRHAAIAAQAISRCRYLPWPGGSPNAAAAALALPWPLVHGWQRPSCKAMTTAGALALPLPGQWRVANPLGQRPCHSLGTVYAAAKWLALAVPVPFATKRVPLLSAAVACPRAGPAIGTSPLSGYCTHITRYPQLVGEPTYVRQRPAHGSAGPQGQLSQGRHTPEAQGPPGPNEPGGTARPQADDEVQREE